MNLKSIIKSAAKLTVGAALTTGFAATTQAKTTADYVQDGLVAMWDAFENAGRGLHVDATNEWTDLVSGRTLPLATGDSFNGCEITLSKAAARVTEDALFTAAGDVTLEFNGRPLTIESEFDMSLIGIPNFARFNWDARDGGVSLVRVDSTGAGQYHFLTYNSGYGNGRELARAAVMQTYSALIGINSSALYVNGGARGRTGGVDWSGGGRSSDFRVQIGNGASSSLVRSIRIYNRKLTAEEIAANRAVDVDRFENGNYRVKASLKGAVGVVGTPTAAEVEVQNLESGWTAEWSTDDGTTYSTERPTFSEKGVYEVRCRVSASGYAPAEVSAQVVVAPKAVKLVSGSVRAGAVTVKDFVALVRLSEDLTPGFKSADLAAGGADLRFFDDAGRMIPHEIDTWATDADPTGTNLVWTLMPELTPTATFYATWGYEAGDGLPANDPTAVWKDYVAVWHLNEASGPAYDSTGHGITANVAEGQEEACVGSSDSPFGGCARANGRGTYSLFADDYTATFPTQSGFAYLSGWFKPTHFTSGSYPGYWSKRNTWGENGFSCNMQANKTEVTVAGNGGNTFATQIPDFTTSGWFRMAVDYLTCGWAWVYYNGAYRNGGGISTITDVRGVKLGFGGIEGCFDEVRLRKEAPNKGGGSSDPITAIEQAEYDQVVNPLYYTQISMGESKSKIAEAVTGSAVQRTVTVNGAMVAVGEGETTVQLLCGDTLVGEPMTVTEIGPFSLVADLSALIGFDTNSVFAVRMVNGENIVTTGTVEVKPIDTAVYTWTQGGDDDEWCNPANWSTPTPDRKDYPQNETATAKFLSSPEGAEWSVHLDRSVSIGDFDLKSGNVHAVIRADSTAQQLAIRPMHTSLAGVSNAVVFATLKLVLNRNAKESEGSFYASADGNLLTLDGSTLQMWAELFVRDMTLKDAVLSDNGGLHVEGGNLVVDNSTLSASGLVLYGKIRDGVVTGGRLTVRGKDAKLTIDNVQTWNTSSDFYAEIRFEIPEGGFTYSPVMNIFSSGSKFFYNSASSYVSVNPESPIFASGLKMPLEQRLIYAAGGFNSSRITVRELPKRFVRAGSAFYWMENGQRYAEIADTRRDLYLTVATPKPGMVLLMK